MNPAKINTPNRTLRILVSSLLLLAFIITALPAPAQAAQACAYYYTIKEGDTTPKIAHTFGFKWRIIALANDMEDPYKLVPGEVLCIPPAGTTTASFTDKSVKVTAVVRGNLITVTASGFDKKQVFIVKVREVTTGAGGWEKVGTLKVPKKRSVTSIYTLPRELRSAIYLEVCLKNATTDEKICRTSFHYY